MLLFALCTSPSVSEFRSLMFTHTRVSAINDDMSTKELIIREVENLPELLQQEVYDFARFLHIKSNDELRREFESWDAASDEDWSKLEAKRAEVE